MSKSIEELIGKINRSKRIIEKHRLDIETNESRIIGYKNELLKKFNYTYE